MGVREIAIDGSVVEWVKIEGSSKGRITLN